MVLEWAFYGDKTYDSLTTAPDYRDGFLRVPETPGIGIEIRDDVVNGLAVPGYPKL
jgi:L-alanine-DL-glutamate epimerase-like enolase superfamily enzyme